MITITETAKKQFQSIGAESFRFGVNSGGCSGFSYSLSEDNQPVETTDEVFLFDDVKIFVDNLSMMYIVGTEIDFVSNTMGSSFKFNNPMQDSACGCGESFNVN